MTVLFIGELCCAAGVCSALPVQQSHLLLEATRSTVITDEELRATDALTFGKPLPSPPPLPSSPPPLLHCSILQMMSSGSYSFASQSLKALILGKLPSLIAQL